MSLRPSKERRARGPKSTLETIKTYDFGLTSALSQLTPAVPAAQDFAQRRLGNLCSTSNKPILQRRFEWAQLRGAIQSKSWATRKSSRIRTEKCASVDPRYPTPGWSATLMLSFWPGSQLLNVRFPDTRGQSWALTPFLLSPCRSSLVVAPLPQPAAWHSDPKMAASSCLRIFP